MFEHCRHTMLPQDATVQGTTTHQAHPVLHLQAGERSFSCNDALLYKRNANNTRCHQESDASKGSAPWHLLYLA